MTSQTNLLLEAATRIGERLVKSALWAGPSCTWEVVRSDLDSPGQQAKRVVGDGTVYQGSAGIALFLFELWALTRDAELLHCARAALRHSLLAQPRAPAARIGFHSGDAGIAYVAARVAALTQQEEWLPLISSRIARIESNFARDTAFDIIGGSAGAIVGLIAISRISPNGSVGELALALGDHLERHAERRVRGWSWFGGLTARQNLCGYGHGASGVAHAFLELYSYTGDPRWQFAAERAIEYERFHVSSEGHDWPDLRCSPVSERLMRARGIESLRTDLRAGWPVPHLSDSVMRAWCHGSPGILLTRLRAMSLGVDSNSCASEASAVVALLRGLIHERHASNFSLCHGAFGNAESVLLAQHVSASQDRDLIRDFACRAAQDFELSGRAWVSGAVGGLPDPSLLVGDAGIGHFLLRLINPAIPSVLFVSSWNSAPEGRAGHETHQQSEVTHFLPRTISAIRRLPNLQPLHEPLGKALSGTTTVAAAIDAVLTMVGDDAAADECLSDALALDLARLDEERAFDDFIAQFCQELIRLRPSEIHWPTATFALPPTTRILCSRWNWDDWLAGESVRLEGGKYYSVIFRERRFVHTRRIPQVVALIFEAMEVPRTFEQITAIVQARLACDANTSAALPAYVARIARNAVMAGIIEARKGELSS